jgi:hypothetical protein
MLSDCCGRRWLLLAFSGDAAVGYGLGHVLAIDETWIPHT